MFMMAGFVGVLCFMVVCFLWLINRDSTPKGPYDDLPSSPPTDFADPEIRAVARDQFKIKSSCWHFNRFNRVTAIKILRKMDPLMVKWKAANPGVTFESLQAAPNNLSTLKFTKDILLIGIELSEKTIDVLSKCPSQDTFTDDDGEKVTFATRIRETQQFLDVYKPIADALR